MVQIIISMVWHGDNPPTHCHKDNELLELFSTGPPDPDVYQGGTWECPKCGRYFAWAIQESEVKPND